VQKDKDLIYQELLVLRCQRGERAALEELIVTWERKLLYFIRRLGHKEADAWDVLQQTWIRVLRGFAGLKEPRNLTSWLYRIARNTAFSHGQMRSHERERLEELPPAADAGEDPGPRTIDDAEQIHHGLLQLALPQREVLTLYFLESMTVEQIAQVLEVPAGTVKSRLYHARNALRAVLTKEDGHGHSS
jgi:RNA polymerase sigma-70 factor (ECF subfamily)